MNLTKIVSAGAVAAGLICSGAYAQTSDSAEGKTHSQALLMAQGSPASGSFKGEPFHGVVDLSVPGGVRNPEAESGSPTNPVKGQQGGGSGVGALSVSATAQAATGVRMNLVDENGVGKEIGQVTISETAYGLVFSPAITGLPPGFHGFHVHENASCEPKEKDGKKMPALAAGGHYDPAGSKRHSTPWGDGHQGDLPALFADANGNTSPVLAPLLKMADLKGRALMIHTGGDNYADQPAPLGGGGVRWACGVIQAP